MKSTRGGITATLAAYSRAALAAAALLPFAAAEEPVPAPAAPDEPIRVVRGATARPPTSLLEDGAEATLATTRELEPAVTAAVDLPANEISLDGMLPGVAPFDHDGQAFGSADGQVCALMLEDFELRSRHSADGGGVFGGEVSIAGATGQPDVKRYAAVQAADGRIYLALVVADPAGDLGLAFTRSDDMCQTWSVPATLVASGAPTHGVRAAALASGASGSVAIVFRGGGGYDPYVIASTDAGNNWTSAVRVDAGVPAGSAASASEDIAIDPATGNLYVVFSQDRGSGESVWVTRSLNGGTSFDPEQSLDAILPVQVTSLNPDVAVAGDGGVLVALWDSAGTSADHVFVVRSANAGLAYGLVLDHLLGTTGVPVTPLLATAPGTSTVFVLFVDHQKRVVLRRSANHGAAYDGTATVLATDAAGSTLGTREPTRIRHARTAAGNWAVSWSDDRDDPYAGLRTDVYVRASIDEGVTWSLEQRVDSDAPGASPSAIDGFAATGADGLFALFEDRRNDASRSSDFFGNRSTTAIPLAFGTDYRLDVDAGQISVDVNLDPFVTTDGASRVYVAFSTFATGPESDIYVAASADGGYTFGTPVLASATPAGGQIRVLPRVAALADGRVYLTYVTDTAAGARQIRFNRSIDFGATWPGTDQLLGTVTSPEPGYYSFLDRPTVQLEARPDGAVYVTWSTRENILFARSIDSGVSFSVEDIDQDVRNFNRAPRLCANGDDVLVVWEGADLTFAYTSVWAVTSPDRGASWDPATHLRPAGLLGGVAPPALVCDGTGGAVAAWPDFRNPIAIQLYTNRFDGTSWLGSVAAAMPGGLNASVPVAAYAGPSTVVVAFAGSDGAIYASRSTDGGGSFPSFARLDDTMTKPAALSAQPRLSTDGAGNLWAAWLDETSGLATLVSRHSPDGGATWGVARRIDRKSPVGGSESFYYPIDSATPATLPGAAFFTWGAERESFLADVLLNAYDLDDLDRDRAIAGADCDDSDPSVPAAPAPVTGLRLAKIAGGVRLSWDSQAATAGPDTVTDVASGLLSGLRSSGGFAGASCQVDGQSGTTYDDLSANPVAGEARYYLLRMTNSCGSGSYGDSSLPIDPRDALDSGPVCD